MRLDTNSFQDFGWPDEVISCSPLPFSPDTCLPREMTKADIESLKENWVAAAKRALKAGFDVSNCTIAPIV